MGQTRHKLLFQTLNYLQSSPRSCPWFAANDGEGGQHHLHHQRRWCAPPSAEPLLRCLLRLQVVPPVMSASVWESDCSSSHGLRSGEQGGSSNAPHPHPQHCGLRSIFTPYVTIKRSDLMTRDMRFAGLVPVASAHIPPSGGNIYKYMPRTFQRVYAISHVSTFGETGRERKVFHNLRRDLLTYIYPSSVFSC
jgi:hypothetical protein